MPTIERSLYPLAAALSLAVLSGCAAPGPNYGGPANPSTPAPYYGGQQVPNQAVQYGRVESVDTIKAESQTSGAGAVIGGVLGAVVGRQIGSGTGRDAATAVGAVGGAIAGNQIEKNRKGSRDYVRVTVRLDNGQTRQFDYEPGVNVQPGERVYVQGDQLMRY